VSQGIADGAWVLDTSVVVKWFLEEEETDRADVLLQQSRSYRRCDQRSDSDAYVARD